MDIHFPKLYRYDRPKEHCHVALPFAKGTLKDEKCVQIYQNGYLMPSQKKITSRYEDGSIRYLFVRFQADLPGNDKAVLEVRFQSEERYNGMDTGLTVTVCENGYEVRTGGNEGISFAVSNGSHSVFDWLEDGNKRYTAKQFIGPLLEDGEGNHYNIQLGKWQAVEEGPLVTALRCKGDCMGEKPITFELKLTAYAGKPWVEISYRIINSTEERLHIASLVFAVMAEEDAVYDASLSAVHDASLSAVHNAALSGNGTMDKAQGLEREASGVCGQKSSVEKQVYHTIGIKELPAIQEAIGSSTIRTCVGSSNYKTDFYIGRDGTPVEKIVDDAFLLGEANEHFAEVLYGTFFADRTDEKGGVCATIYQAQQNYPKAVKADAGGIYVLLVPKDVNRVVMESGMSREQRFLLHFHSSGESLMEIDNRSLIYQMPDKPSIPPEAFRDAGVMPDIFVEKEKINYDVEIALIGKCDGHARCYGMLNWGDAPDAGYTTQGRGGGKPVWTNNEYDYPHACALLYARTGERRFLDYMITAGSHWMDVDVCHYSRNLLLMGGQWEHTRGHCQDGSIVCSHEWVEGLLDCYHFTGDERALETALGIGENVLRLLDTPMYQKSGEINARETGWALRTLTALYIETNDKKWLKKCEWIVGQFKEWAEEYGGWLAPYTDNTMIRTGFMISVAVGSLMRYYRVFPREEIREMILQAVDDLVEHCLMDNGLFYYKELPSLNRLGSNTLLLEALTIAYELSGALRYLTYGKRTFWSSIHAPAPSAGGVKTIVEDAVIHKAGGTKNFAQCFIPLSLYYKAMADNDML